MDNKSSYTKQELLDIVKEQWFFKCHLELPGHAWMLEDMLYWK